jgi:hypothetical protein
MRLAGRTGAAAGRRAYCLAGIVVGTLIGWAGAIGGKYVLGRMREGDRSSHDPVLAVLELEAQLHRDSVELTKAGRFDEAEWKAKQLIHLDWLEALSAYGALYQAQGRSDEYADTMTREYLSTFRIQMARLLLMLCRGYERAGKLDEGLEFFKQYKSRIALDMYAYHVAYLRLAKGEKVDVERLTKWLKGDPIWDGSLPPRPLREYPDFERHNPRSQKGIDKKETNEPHDAPAAGGD